MSAPARRHEVVELRARGLHLLIAQDLKKRDFCATHNRRTVKHLI